MTIRHTTLAAALALAFIGPAHAEGLKPLQGQVIDLGDVSGVAYYTVERDDFRVVATLAKKDEDAVPVRVVAVLGPDQSLTLSTPHEAAPRPTRSRSSGESTRCSSTRWPRWPRRSRTERGPPNWRRRGGRPGCAPAQQPNVLW